MSEQDQFDRIGHVVSMEPSEKLKEVFLVTISDENPRPIQVSKFKKNGEPTKVFPLIMNSLATGSVYRWGGNTKTITNEHGTFTYYTANWGELLDEKSAPTNGSVSPPTTAEGVEGDRGSSSSTPEAVTSGESERKTASVCLSYAKDITVALANRGYFETYTEVEKEVEALTIRLAQNFALWMRQEGAPNG